MMNHAMSGDHQMPGMMQMHGQGEMQTGVNAPTMAGQDAFGAIQEIVRILRPILKPTGPKTISKRRVST